MLHDSAMFTVKQQLTEINPYSSAHFLLKACKIRRALVCGLHNLNSVVPELGTNVRVQDHL